MTYFEWCKVSNTVIYRQKRAKKQKRQEHMMIFKSTQEWCEGRNQIVIVAFPTARHGSHDTVVPVPRFTLSMKKKYPPTKPVKSRHFRLHDHDQADFSGVYYPCSRRGSR